MGQVLDEEQFAEDYLRKLTRIGRSSPKLLQATEKVSCRHIYTDFDDSLNGDHRRLPFDFDEACDLERKMRLFGGYHSCEIPCSMVTENTFEVLVNQSDPFMPMASIFRQGNGYEFLLSELNFEVRISNPTNEFVHLNRFEEPFMQIFKYSRPFNAASGKKVITVDDISKRLVSIKVEWADSQSIEDMISQAKSRLSSILFHSSYLLGFPILLTTSWDKNAARGLKRFTPLSPDRPEEKQLELKDVVLNDDLVSFYTQGRSSRSPILEFLSYYHIFEYLFISTQDLYLGKMLVDSLRDPGFSLRNSAQVMKIVQKMVDHSRLSDESDMLKLVFDKYLIESDVSDAISKLEMDLEKNIYTGKHRIFGKSFEVKLSSGHILGNLAKRIKHIRNAVVHSSDRHEGLERYVPYTEYDEVVANELPMMRFLSEKIILSSSS